MTPPPRLPVLVVFVTVYLSMYCASTMFMLPSWSQVSVTTAMSVLESVKNWLSRSVLLLRDLALAVVII